MQLISILQMLGLLAIVVRPAAAAPIQVNTEGSPIATINGATNSTLQERWAEPAPSTLGLGMYSLPKYAQMCIEFAFKDVKDMPQSWADKPIKRWKKPEDFCNSQAVNANHENSSKWVGFAPNFQHCMISKTWEHDKGAYWESVTATEDWVKKLCGDGFLKKLPMPLRVKKTAYSWAEGPEAHGYGVDKPSS